MESETGLEFLRCLTRVLPHALGVRGAFVSQLSPDGSTFRSLALAVGGVSNGQLELPVIGGPCEPVLRGQITCYPRDLRERFPEHHFLAEWGAESYCGVPFRYSTGAVAGHLVIVHDEPMEEGPPGLDLLELFARRAGTELERIGTEEGESTGSATLLRILEGTAAATGGEFFRALVKNLAAALGVQHAFVSVFTESKTRVRTLAFWSEARFLDAFEYDLVGTPCEGVLRGEIGYYPDRVAERFPLDREELEAIGAESYLAIPLRGSDGEILGHLAVIDGKPMPDRAKDLSVFRIFGARAAAEIERLSVLEELAEKEERLRDLFDEAPIAYVHEGLDTRFIRANQTAMRILGIDPSEVESTFGRSLIPDTPEAQERVKNAIETIERGATTAGVVLELRRKDDGRPIWIQWWSKPDPSGRYTRTMFLDVTDRILMERENSRLEARNDYLQEEIKSERNFDEIVGNSPAIRKVFESIQQVAPTDSTVLVTGETGTGKELIARAIHDRSSRSDGVLVRVNCAAIPAGLIESELFGHEKGAFTGALTRKVGRFEVANGATIFLDEVGELPVDLQSKLLRVLQEGEFERLGSTETIRVDVRVIAATNRDLERAIRKGEFRADLYYRLNVFPISVPALRHRRGDVPLLVKYFVWKYGSKMGKRLETISDTALQSLEAYPWPGNIRELENVIERGVILSRSSELELGDWLPKPGPVRAAVQTPTLQELEKAHILSVLDLVGWRVSGEKGAARILGLKPTTLEARMKKHGIVRKRN